MIVGSAMIERMAAEIRAVASTNMIARLTKDDAEILARAALQALMEPTPGMVEAGGDCPIRDYDGNDPVEVWQAMIRSAMEGE